MSKRSSNLPRRQLGRYLRELRQQCGLSIVQAAKLAERSSGSLQRLETGATERIQLRDIEELCRIYDAPDYVEPLKGLAQQANVKSWWHEYGDLNPAGFNVYGEPVEPTVIYVESYAGDLYLEGTTSVELYRQAHTAIRAAALDAADSKNMLRRLAKEFAP